MLLSFFDGKEKQLEQELYKLTAYLSTNKLRQMAIDAEAKRGGSITDGEAKKALIANVLFGNVNQSRHHKYKSVQAFKKEFPLLLLIIEIKSKISIRYMERFDHVWNWCNTFQIDRRG